MNRWLDCIQIWYGCSLGISIDLIIFWDESMFNKIAAAAIFSKMAAYKACGHDNLRTVGWITFKFGMAIR